MLEGIRGLEEIPLVPTTTQPVYARRRTILYIAVSQAAVSAALVRDEGGSQRPVYFISRAFQRAEERYPRMEKLAFELVTTARKLKSYFQAYTIIVLTNQPLKRAMSSPEAVERMALSAIELSEFDVQYHPRTVVKGQIVADFITEYTQSEDKEAEGHRLWSIHTDGSSN